MISMVIWVLAMAGSIAAVCFTVALDAQSAHLSATALVSFGIVAAAVSEHRTCEMAGRSGYSLAATAARYMGLLWSWSALSAFVVYEFLLDWPYWMPIVVAMFVVCGLCLFIGLILDREAASETPDAWADTLGWLISVSQFVLACMALGVVIAVRQQPDAAMGGAPRWVALNLVLCTTAALLTFTGYLIVNRRSGAATLTADTEAVGVA